MTTEKPMTYAEREVREVVERLETTWNAGDSHGFAAQFAEDADFINVIGTHHHGRADIDAGRRQVFDTIYKGIKVKYSVDGIRFIRADVAAAFVRTRLELHEDETISMQTTMLLTKDDGKWQIVVFQNTGIAQARAQKRWEERK